MYVVISFCNLGHSAHPKKTSPINDKDASLFEINAMLCTISKMRYFAHHPRYRWIYLSCLDPTSHAISLSFR